MQSAYSGVKQQYKMLPNVLADNLMFDLFKNTQWKYLQFTVLHFFFLSRGNLLLVELK